MTKRIWSLNPPPPPPLPLCPTKTAHGKSEGAGGEGKGKGLLAGTLDIGVGIAHVSITLTPVFVIISYHCILNWELRREKCSAFLRWKVDMLFQLFHVNCVKRSKACHLCQLTAFD